ncbi:MAG: response regulator [Alphaproteobacteria bacterium]|nr:response regulator [Alphaproteobacteria bacterium]
MLEGRILAVDDETAMLQTYQAVLGQDESAGPSKSGDLEVELFGVEKAPAKPRFELELCRQGEEAVDHVRAALGQGKGYAVVFLDVRMPPGIDGLETARRLRALDPDLYIVIVTGYSDHHPRTFVQAALPPEKLIYLCKPFQPAEIEQLAFALCRLSQSDRVVRRELASLRAQIDDSMRILT